MAGALEAPGCCPQLSVLNLVGNNFWNGGVPALARALRNPWCPAIKNLSLAGESLFVYPSPLLFDIFVISLGNRYRF